MVGFWFGVVPLVALISLVIGIGLGWTRATSRRWARGIAGVFALQLLYASLLIVLLLIYVNDPKSLPFPKTIAGVPIGVPWFGAFGAITVSMSALSDHRHNWDPEWWYWHASRPLVGAIAGSVTVLFFIAGILAVQQNGQSGSPIATSQLLYYALAFVIGYREASFRALLKAVIDLLLRPAGTGLPTSVSGTEPKQGFAGDSVTIFGTGLSQVNSVTFDANEAPIASASETTLIVQAPPHSAGSVPVVVRTKDATFGANTFTYLELIPVGAPPSRAPSAATTEPLPSPANFESMETVATGSNSENEGPG
jgi:IPT/TIG domain